MICMLFGGRVAEEITFNQITTGASNDLDRASSIARKMVCEWGMSESLGPAAFSDLTNRQFGEMSSYSPDTLRKIDEEILSILNKCYQKTKMHFLGLRETKKCCSAEGKKWASPSSKKTRRFFFYTPYISMSKRSNRSLCMVGI